MPESIVTASKRRNRDRNEYTDTTTAGGEVAGARKRRAILHTMGQQLRELGVDGTSPQGPGNHGPLSRSAHSGTNHVSTHVMETPESDAAPGEDDRLPAGAARSASKWLWKLNEVHPPSTSGLAATLPFDDLLDWSQSYFDHWHPGFPFLHAPSLVDYMRHIAQAGLQIPAKSSSAALQHVILCSVMSISVADRRQMDVNCKPVPTSLVFSSFNDAINSIQLVLTEESSILSLQALVAVQLFLITMHRYNAASRLEGLATRMALQLGLHRCPLRTASSNFREAELRKRLFWSIYCIDRYISIRLGTPLAIRSDEMDVCFPHDERHDRASGADTDCDDRLSFLEFLARHASIRGAIMETRNKSALQPDYNEGDEVMEVDAEHTKWWNTVDEYLSTDDGAGNILKVHQVTLLVLRFESVLALHRSVLATSKKNSAYNAALQRCISAARSVINTLHKAIQGFGAIDGSPGQRGYESTPLVWPSFTWAVWMSVFIVVFAASEGQVARETALRLSDRSVQILQHLALRGTSWPDACVIAVQNLTTRLREGSSRSSTAAPGDHAASSYALSTSAAAAPQEPRSAYGQMQHGGPGRRSGDVMPFTSMRPPGVSQSSFNPASSPFHNPSISTGLERTPIPSAYMHSQGAFGSVNNYLDGAGTFLGIAQQSSDNPIPNEEIMHLFDGEGMAAWFNDSIAQPGGI